MFDADVGPGAASPELRAVRDAVEISVFAAEQAPVLALARYAVLFARVFAESHAMLNAWDGEAAARPGGGLVFAEAGGELQAALRFERPEEDDGASLCFKGLVSAGRIRGLVAPMIAAAVIAERKRGADPPAGRAVVRVLPQGEVNVPSAKPFARLGFVPWRLLSVGIEARDCHLSLSTEPEGPFFRGLEMRAPPGDLASASASALGAWQMEGGHG